MLTKTVIILSFGVRVGPISTETARGEGANPKNTPRFRQKVLLKAEFEGTPGLLSQEVSIFWIRALSASSLSTYGSDTGSE